MNSQDKNCWTFVLETLVLDRQMEPKAYLLHSFPVLGTEAGKGIGSGLEAAAFEVRSPSVD